MQYTKDKTLVAVIGGALTAGLTSAAQFVPVESTIAHVISAVIAVVGFVLTSLGVYLVPNTEVGAAVTAVGEAVKSVVAELAPPTPLTDDEIADALATGDALAGRHAAPAEL